jgi:hypothetical protein
MPLTAAWIDELRKTFGAEMINKAIKGGMAGEGSFYAAEAGKEVGSRPRDIAGHGITGNEMASAGRCDGCRQLYMKLVSPDGQHQQRACRKYKVAAQKCADWSAK